MVYAVHLTQMRSCLGEVYQQAGRPSPSYTDPTIEAGTTVVKAVHVQELMAAVNGV